MSNELIETPTEIENDVEEATQPEVAAPEATEGAESKPTEPAKTAEQLEVERLRRQLTKRDRTQGKMHGELEQLRAERAQWAQRQPAEQQTERQEVPGELKAVVEREAMTLAERIAERREFDAKCNTVAETGKKDFPDFSDALNALIEEAGPLVDAKGSATPLGALVLESDAPAKLIHYLGKHPEIAAELDGLTTGRMARKLAVIEQEMTAKPKTSAAPKPIEPVSGRATSASGYSPEMTDLQFAKWRKAQRAK